MSDYFAMITGGPVKYAGRSARDAHKSQNIMSHEFETYKSLLRSTFIECGSTNESVSELMNLLDTIKIDVIGGKPPSLFEKLGGEDIVNYLTERLFDNIMDEKRIRHYFINVDLKSVKLHFKEFLYMATGGHFKYITTLPPCLPTYLSLSLVVQVHWRERAWPPWTDGHQH